MTAIAFIGFAIATLIGLVVGIRLALVALRTRRLPETLLALVLLLSIFGANLLHGAALTLGGEGEVLLRGAAMFCANLGPTLLLLFLWRVLHPTERWFGLLFGVAVGTAMASLAGEAVTGSLHTPLVDGTWGWLGFAVRLSAFGLTAIEVLREHARLDRQRNLGLVDALTTHRVLLWGLAASAAATVVFVTGFASALSTTADRVPLVGLVTGTVGIAAAAFIWLAFFPPAFYRRWIDSEAVEFSPLSEDGRP
jgi:hypothetical protein